MRIRHLLPNASARATVEGDRGFLLRNQQGDFLSLYTTCQTRYQGWFLEKEAAFFKVLDRIEVLDGNGTPREVSAITNLGSRIIWEYAGGVKASWKLVPGARGLSYSLTEQANVKIYLDPRPMYSSPSLGRGISMTETEGGLMLRYQEQNLPYPFFLHLRSKTPLSPEYSWKEEQYPRDGKRNSPPTSLYVIELQASPTIGLGLGGGWSEKEALEASLIASQQRPAAIPTGPAMAHDTLVNQMTAAKVLTYQSLRSLQSSKGLYAGLPWFHQVWTRDELIAALGLPADQQHEIIDRYLGMELQDGELPTYKGSHSTCADGVGWLCLLVQEHGPHNLPESTLLRLRHFLERARTGLMESRQASHGLIASGHNATWMDTIGRSGFRLDVQCMFASVLELLYYLTEDETYQREHLQALGRIRQFFFQGGYLHDGLGDPAKRPNVFLAYLLQPSLLNQASWRSCFDAVLAVTRTEWGGLTSLDKTDPAFRPETTGENNQSYHNGDSWFFINNLAGIALHRLDPNGYGKDIVGILQSSTNEILWENFIGHPGEISSAARLESFGCGAQAFSGGAYLALLQEMEDYSARHDLASMDFFWESTAD